MAKFIAPVDDHLSLSAVIGLSPGDALALRHLGIRAPDPIPVRFLIDTGAKRSTLTPLVFHQLGPMSGTEVHMLTASGTFATTMYWVRIGFPESGLAAFEHVQVARVAMPAALSQFHGLLGRDLLGSLESFVYEGQKGRYFLRDRAGPFSWLRQWL